MYDLIKTTLCHLLALLKGFLHLHASGRNYLYTYCTFKETDIYCRSRWESVGILIVDIGGPFFF